MKLRGQVQKLLNISGLRNETETVRNM